MKLIILHFTRLFVKTIFFLALQFLERDSERIMYVLRLSIGSYKVQIIDILFPLQDPFYAYCVAFVIALAFILIGKN